MLSQRINNHHYDEINIRTLQTRSRHLCSAGTFDRMGTAWNDIGTYLWQYKTTVGIEGKYICSVADIIWILLMVMEIRRVSELLYAITCIPNNNTRGGNLYVDAK